MLHRKKRQTVCGRILLLLLLLSLFFVVKFDGGGSPRMIVVADGFSSIQAAINNADVGDVIFVHNGTYYENLVVSKRLTLVGENRYATIIDGNNSGSVVVVSANYVNITGFTLRNSGLGWPNTGITVRNSYLCVFADNIITNNHVGILLEDSPTNRFVGNVINENWYGIYVSSSSGNMFENNNVTSNGQTGLMLSSSSNSKVEGNLIEKNTNGIYLSYSPNNHIYYNNFVDNGYQARTRGGSVNVWDNGYPAGGNYWSDYAGADLYSGSGQNLTGSDGIGDTPYFIDGSNQDQYPYIEAIVVLHDIAVKDVTLSASSIYEGHVMNISVVVANLGKYTETFSTTVYYDEMDIATQVVTHLTANSESTLRFMWNTSGVQSNKTYTIKAKAKPVPGETNLDNNVLVGGTVKVRSYALWAVKIVEVVSSDESGEPVSSFAKGTMAHFKITVNNTSFESQIVLVTVNVYDPSNATLGVVSFHGLIMPGTSVFILGLPIPSASNIGVATVYANAFTDWPYVGGLPYGPELSATFQIVGY